MTIFPPPLNLKNRTDVFIATLRGMGNLDYIIKDLEGWLEDQGKSKLLVAFAPGLDYCADSQVLIAVPVQPLCTNFHDNSVIQPLILSKSNITILEKKA